MDMTRAHAVSESMVGCSFKANMTSQYEEIKRSLDILNEKLVKVMTMVQDNFENIEKMKDEVLILRKDVSKNKESPDDEDLKSMKL